MVADAVPCQPVSALKFTEFNREFAEIWRLGPLPGSKMLCGSGFCPEFPVQRKREFAGTKPDFANSISGASNPSIRSAAPRAMPRPSCARPRLGRWTGHRRKINDRPSDRTAGAGFPYLSGSWSQVSINGPPAGSAGHLEALSVPTFRSSASGPSAEIEKAQKAFAFPAVKPQGKSTLGEDELQSEAIREIFHFAFAASRDRMKASKIDEITQNKKQLLANVSHASRVGQRYWRPRAPENYLALLTRATRLP